MPARADDSSTPVRPPTFDRTALLLLAAAVAAGLLALPILVLWRGFTWSMALASGAGIAVLVFFSGRAVRVLRFEYLRPPFEREE